jgi:hypothetical protein
MHEAFTNLRCDYKSIHKSNWMEKFPKHIFWVPRANLFRYLLCKNLKKRISEISRIINQLSWGIVQSVCFSSAKIIDCDRSSHRIPSHGPLIQLDWQFSRFRCSVLPLGDGSRALFIIGWAATKRTVASADNLCPRCCLFLEQLTGDAWRNSEDPQRDLLGHSESRTREQHNYSRTLKSSQKRHCTITKE